MVLARKQDETQRQCKPFFLFPFNSTTALPPASLARFNCSDLERETRLVIALLYLLVYSPLEHRTMA